MRQWLWWSELWAFGARTLYVLTHDISPLIITVVFSGSHAVIGPMHFHWRRFTAPFPVGHFLGCIIGPGEKSKPTHTRRLIKGNEGRGHPIGRQRGGKCRHSVGRLLRYGRRHQRQGESSVGRQPKQPKSVAVTNSTTLVHSPEEVIINDGRGATAAAGKHQQWIWQFGKITRGNPTAKGGIGREKGCKSTRGNATFAALNKWTLWQWDIWVEKITGYGGWGGWG